MQEAKLGCKNDEKKDRLPALWERGALCEFGSFWPQGLLTLTCFRHIKRAFDYWKQ